MQIGQKVISDLYAEQGEGIVINITKIFNKEFCTVFYKKNGTTIEIQTEDLKLLDTPINQIKQQMQSTPIEFKLNLLSHDIEVLSSGEQALAPINFKITPLPHQLLALNFVIDQFRPRCLLADEVGLGKTIEAALIMEELKLRNIVKRILIVTPAGLTNQWRDELKLKFAEDFSVFNNETFKSFRQLYGEDTNCWLKFDRIITSMDFLKPKKISNDLGEKEKERREEHNKHVLNACINANWDMVIIDEAHKLSKYQTGEETARYKLGKILSDSVPIFIILTATPHRGKPFVFKNLLNLVDPYSFIRMEDVIPENVQKITVKNKKRACIDFNGNHIFKERITSIAKIKWDPEIDVPEKKLYEAVVEYISEYYDYAQQEKNQILIFLLMLYQRIVSSSSRAILKSLEKRFETIKSLTQQAQQLREASLDEFFDIPGETQLDQLEKIVPILKNPHLVKKEIQIITKCIELAKNSIIGRNDAKLRKLIKIIDEVKKNENDKDVKLLIFTEFIETQKYIIESLEQLGYTTAFINGNLQLHEKIRQKQKFKEKAQIMVSTDAGGEGINLQFCHVIINYDLPWNPMSIEQRIGRVDRIGQEKDVIAINFVLSDTIEEYVREKIETKLEIIKEQFGEDKLRDILSTMDEEFRFDKIYIDYLVKHKKQETNLDEISEQIYKKTKEIIENNEILIPFTDQENISNIQISEIQNISKKIQKFTELFLQNRNLIITEYKDKTGVYYFKNDFRTDLFEKLYSKIIFDQKKGLDDEDAELLSFTHPYIKESINHSKQNGRFSALKLKNQKFAGTKGYLINWLFTISNNFNMHRQYIIPTFITDKNEYNRRISDYLRNIEEIELIESSTNDRNVEESFEKAEKIANEIGEGIFWEVEKNWKEKIKSNQEKMEKYYKQKAKAVAQIKIDNIQQSKQKELQIEKHNKNIELKKQSQLFPDINCFQIAQIEFI
ncbi:DNA/RNA helicase, superfamily II, SNF2 family [Thermoplasmatales archaeon SCGC AB-539-N05]|nr:DNA/RNA helicase, superfamily II, SNF2 family [Thermoplasmatales archaeon SCGC AB-539-N05]